jgi:DNA-binding FadR family transcriptional regulator
LFVQILASFGPLMEVAVPTAWRTRTATMRRDTMVERHQAVARAIKNRDSIAAAMAMGAHFDTSIGDLLKRTPA